MKERHYTYLLYFISLVILATIGTQLYWNYKNYEVGKQRLTTEIQTSFNDAITAYYIDMEKKNTRSFFTDKKGSIFKNAAFDSLFNELDFTENGIKNLNNIDPKTISSIQVFKGVKALEDYKTKKRDSLMMDTSQANTKKINYTSSITISFRVDTLKTEILTPYIKEQLRAKNIDVDYGYVFQTKKGEPQRYHPAIIRNSSLKTVSKSGYLPDDSSFDIYFTNAKFTILKRNLLGILLSTLLVCSVVACLFWLLHIIRRQKQLAELKNDLISNITHEFKTPISTIGVALEGIQHFNPNQDPKKTRNYLNTSTTHLKKLSFMVEKLLETATLDSGDLQLDKEKIELTPLLENLIKKHKSICPDKIIELQAENSPFKIQADTFHLENAFNNLLDNAVKYGGNHIKVFFKPNNDSLEIVFEDSGNSLTKEQSKHLFDKFYRVPKGNTHDVKGFGIGLYYTKKIIEKHGGNIVVRLTNSTNFIVNLPYE